MLGFLPKSASYGQWCYSMVIAMSVNRSSLRDTSGNSPIMPMILSISCRHISPCTTDDAFCAYSRYLQRCHWLHCMETCISTSTLKGKWCDQVKKLRNERFPFNFDVMQISRSSVGSWRNIPACSLWAIALTRKMSQIHLLYFRYLSKLILNCRTMW